MSSEMISSPFKSDIFKGKVVLITGGGSGIGLEISRQFGLHGATVFISGRRDSVLKESVSALKAQGIDAHSVQGDVRNYEDCERMVESSHSYRNRLDVLVNCAAGNFLSPAEQLSSNGFKTVMEIDAVGTFNTSRAAFPALRRRVHDSPCIINISATLHYGATWYQAHASAAKAAVDSLTRSLALEWGHSGIRVNGIAPGPIAGTAGITKLAPGIAEKAQELVASRIPLGKMGRKWDIAIGCVFLASDAASFMTGHTLVVDGGEWMFKEPLLPREEVGKVSRGVEGQSRKIGLASLSKL